MLKINKETELTPVLLKRIIEGNASERSRLSNLEGYYLGKHAIQQRQMNDLTKPNNKLVNSYPSYITDVLTAYFMAEPIAYSSLDTGLIEELQAIFTYNDEQDENMELAKDASIYGIAYELTYVDEEGQVRFKRLDPKDCIPVIDNTVEEELVFFIRYFLEYDIVKDENYYAIEVYSKDKVSTYTANDSLGDITLTGEMFHYFGMVPIAMYKNNEHLRGDFEPVISLIDAYDKMESDSLNDFEYFCDAYLALYGFTAEPEDVANMKENRVLLMDHDTKAEWLIKNTPDTAMENLKNRLDADIHRFTKCPNLLDESFAGNASGVAIKYKMMGTENLAGIKERKFKKGLQRRIELISVVNSLMADGFDWRAIEIVFSRSLPANEVEIANMVSTLSGIVSEETLLAQLPFITNVQEELERIKKDKEQDPFYDKALAYNNEEETIVNE